MSEETTPVPAADPAPAPAPVAGPAAVSFTADDAIQIVNTIGALVAAVNPASAAAVAVATGAAALVRDTIVPAVQHLLPHQVSVVQQAALKAWMDSERVRLNLPPSTTN